MRTTEMVLFAHFLKTSKFIPACIVHIYIYIIFAMNSVSVAVRAVRMYSGCLSTHASEIDLNRNIKLNRNMKLNPVFQDRE